MPDYIVNSDAIVRTDVIVRNIRNGYHDKELDRIGVEITRRREYLATAKRYEFQIGDVVRFNAEIHPKYLVGKTATIAKINRKTASVVTPDHIHEYHRFNNTTLRCPLSMIESAEAP
jgi:hypothetical protein